MISPGVYIIKSERINRYYVGCTENVSRRVNDHNVGKVFSTRNKGPWNLMVFVECKSLKEAKELEYRLKKYKRRDILEKVIFDKTFPWDYSDQNRNPDNGRN